jgi:hypothetical protein
MLKSNTIAILTEDKTVYGTKEHPLLLAPASCLCCEKCWFIMKGKGAGKCVNGGPYLGYIEIPDP